MNRIVAILKFIFWRLKIFRQFGKLYNTFSLIFNKACLKKSAFNESNYLEPLNLNGYCKLKTMHVPDIELNNFSGTARGKSFVDISDAVPDVRNILFCKLMESEGVSDLINSYFDGRPRLWNVALNYSDPSDSFTDSQLWHFDYGDNKQLHLLVYLSDVDQESGPFTFINKIDSKIAKRSCIFVERWMDKDLQRIGINLSQSTIKLIGVKGDVFAADPGVILHQGARCSKPRLVMFVSFTSRRPMMKAKNHTLCQKERNQLYQYYIAHASVPMLQEETFLC